MTIRRILALFAFLLLWVGLKTTAQIQDRPVADGTLRRIFAPILMYHYVSPLPKDADDYRIGLTVEPHIFYQQMEYLSNSDYSVVSLYEIDQALRLGIELPLNPLILTFDDGHIDHYTTVFPILKEFGLDATFFIVTEFADQARPEYMNWAQIREMADAGFSMESHSKNHPDLSNRNYDFLVYQFLGSMESLAHFTGNTPAFFAYPAGRYDNMTIDVIADTPIRRAVTTVFGAYHSTDNRYEMPRLRVTNDMGPAGIRHLIEAARNAKTRR